MTSANESKRDQRTTVRPAPTSRRSGSGRREPRDADQIGRQRDDRLRIGAQARDRRPGRRRGSSTSRDRRRRPTRRRPDRERPAPPAARRRRDRSRRSGAAGRAGPVRRRPARAAFSGSRRGAAQLSVKPRAPTSAVRTRPDSAAARNQRRAQTRRQRPSAAPVCHAVAQSPRLRARRLNTRRPRAAAARSPCRRRTTRSRVGAPAPRAS